MNDNGDDEVVIQSNMSPLAIVEIWESTEEVFKKYSIPLTTKQTIEEFVTDKRLGSLLEELNSVVGSSSSTCIEGG